MAGGADGNPGEPCQQQTGQEIFAAAVESFKCEVDTKVCETFNNEARWIHWWSQFRVTLNSQGLGPAIDINCTPQ
jgi:hypothetical protein